VPSVNRALQIAKTLEFKDYSDSDYQKGEMLLNIAKRLAELRQNDLAQQVAQSIKNDSWKAQALATVAAQLNQSRSSKINLK
jgi:glutaminase